MTPLKERKLAYYMTGILLVVGAISYAAFPVKTPEEPVRLMFNAVAGDVLFAHQTHASVKGYGIACNECHHHPEESEDGPLACSACHQIPPEGEKAPKACLDCHDISELEDSVFMKSSDAFHAQCIGCHEDFGKGPGEGPEKCSACHVQ
jgi:hypothetical protein